MSRDPLGDEEASRFGAVTTTSSVSVPRSHYQSQNARMVSVNNNMLDLDGEEIVDKVVVL